MTLESLIGQAQAAGASDLHLEPGLPAALRIRGTLRANEEPVPPAATLAMAQELIGETEWPAFLERRSFDLSRTIQGVRCRINVLQTARGVGLAVRLLAAFQATLERLNLHPDLGRLVARPNGLILISGPTGSGKSSTLAALIQEINLSEPRHVVTVESPIEYFFRPQRAYIRQREVGRDTPSFEQALIDALREDPDVLMVGEMREPETMRLTLNAAETGHLVLATVHSATCIEALQRVVGAFPSEIQSAVAGQLADCLAGVVAQRLQYRPDLKIRVPECEILVSNHPVKAHIRSREFFKIASAMETGADHGMWTLARYRLWLDKRKQWHIPRPAAEAGGAEAEPVAATKPAVPTLAATLASAPRSRRTPTKAADGSPASGPIEIEPVEGGIKRILRKFEDT